MVIQLSSIIDYINQFLWPFFRIAGLFMTAPFFGDKVIPARIKLFLSLIVSLSLAPLISIHLNLLDFKAITIALSEIGLGVIMGFLIKILFQVFVIAGQLVALQSGFGFSQLMDPQNGVSVTTISEIYLLAITLVFLSLDGHLFVIQMLKDSFSWVPVGSLFDFKYAFKELSFRLSWCLSAAFVVALPTVAALFIVNIAFAVMTRSAPQLNIFTVGFPITLVAGIVLLTFSFNLLPMQFQNLYDNTGQFINHLMRMEYGSR